MSESIFSVVGPIMIGPSSSHTAGAVRLALLVRKLANQPIKTVNFHLYNSFAKTYRGHGTDKGLIAGILNIGVSDAKVAQAEQEAKTAKLNYQFTLHDEPNNYPPNTVKFKLTLADDSALSVIGHSVGGGRVLITKINDYNVSLQGEMATLIMVYNDKPGMIWRTTKVIAESETNIATLQCSRLKRGTTAFMTITLDEPLSQPAIDEINAIENVHWMGCFDKLPD
jgi:L-serine dehydratase